MSLESGVDRSYAVGTRVRCYVKGNVYFLPDAMSDLCEEVAIRYANFSNLIGFQDGSFSFDGAGWGGSPGAGDGRSTNSPRSCTRISTIPPRFTPAAIW